MKVNEINIKLSEHIVKHSVNVGCYFIIIIYYYWNKDPNPLQNLAPANLSTLISLYSPSHTLLLSVRQMLHVLSCLGAFAYADSLACFSLPPSLCSPLPTKILPLPQISDQTCYLRKLFPDSHASQFAVIHLFVG